MGLWLTLRTVPTVTSKEMSASGDAMLRAHRVVAVVAHPDDAEYWISGTLARLGKAGARVVLVVVSDGEKGRNLVGSADLGATRRAEQRTAGGVLGYSEVVFLGQPDRSAADGPDVRAMILDVLRKELPDLVITFDGWKPEMPYLHPDHEAVGRLTVRAVEEASLGAGIYLFHTRRPNVAVDISSVVQAKADAFNAHVSQNGGNAGEGPVRRMREVGKRYGLPPVELFRKLK